MNYEINHTLPSPTIDNKEAASLDALTKKYESIIKPSKFAELGEKAVNLIPDKIKEWGKDLGVSMTEQEIYAKMMSFLADGFHILEEQAAKFSVSEAQILSSIKKSNKGFNTASIEEICLLRSYDIAKAVNKYRSQDILAATLEGGSTGALGLAGLPFNIILSTFLYYRAVQSIAMHYGYDVKNDYSEMVIASEVFASALNPSKDATSSETTAIVAKIMTLTQTALVQQTSKKGWTAMAKRGGIPLLLTQMRALASSTAAKALQKAGKAGLEKSLFSDVLEQIGRKLTLKSLGKVTAPVAGAIICALMDTAQMAKVLDFADIFYQKRFILEKEARISTLFHHSAIIDAEIVED